MQGEAGCQWNEKAFSMLYQLFQMGVPTVEPPGYRHHDLEVVTDV